MTVIPVWLGIGLGVALLPLAAWASDRRSQRHGHHLRAGADIYRDVREEHRDLRAGHEQRYLNPDQSWTHRSRQGEEEHAR
jgi:hypothetical protein